MPRANDVEPNGVENVLGNWVLVKLETTKFTMSITKVSNTHGTRSHSGRKRSRLRRHSRRRPQAQGASKSATKTTNPPKTDCTEESKVGHRREAEVEQEDKDHTDHNELEQRRGRSRAGRRKRKKSRGETHPRERGPTSGWRCR